MGRLFGTGRPPRSSFSNQVDRQLETGTPVERLDGAREAGGSRRARKNDPPGSRRGRRGPRPEESRAERQASGELSRRESEATSRSRRARPAGDAVAARPDPFDAEAGERRSDFGERLRAKSEASPGTKRRLAAQARTPESTTTPKPAASPDGPQAQAAPISSALPVAKPSVPAPAGPNLAAPGRAAAAPTGAALPANGVGAKAEPVSKTVEAAAPEAATRWSDSEASERASAVLRQLRVHINPSVRTATIQLAPADLGRLSIKLRVDDGRVQASVRAETPETLAILERHIPELQAALASQGLEAEGFELHLGFGDERSAEGADEPGSPDPSGAAEDPNEIDLDPNLLARTVASRSGLDTYA